jgi:hypothetical protein
MGVLQTIENYTSTAIAIKGYLLFAEDFSRKSEENLPEANPMFTSVVVVTRIQTS